MLYNRWKYCYTISIINIIENIKLEYGEKKPKVNLSAIKFELEVAMTKVSPRLELISADCPVTSQAEKGEPYTHEAQLTSYVIITSEYLSPDFEASFSVKVELQTFRAHTTCNSED